MILNIFISTFLSLKAHKLRVFLTMVGIIIGITSVVTISTLGEGMKRQVLATTDSTNASNVKIIYSMEQEDASGMGYIEYQDSDFNFSMVDLKKVKDIKGLQSIYPDYGQQFMGDTIDQELDYFGTKAYLYVAPNKGEVKLKYGRNFQPSDANRDVIILSYNVFEGQISMDNPEELINQAVSIGGYMYKVIGITESVDYESLSTTDMMGGFDYMSTMTSYVSKSSYNELAKSKAISGIKLKLSEGVNREEVLGQIISALQELHPDVKGVFKEDDTNQQQQQQVETMIGGLTSFLMAITAISLLVGGIGVMNIMYVSVTERKREIGIRRAIGAKPRTILMQFLLEAAFITLLGGLIGIALGYGLSSIVGGFVQIKPVMTPQIFMISSIVSILTGIVFGIIPAINAARMDPIKAIYR
ncbi:ABC transporter permease [Carnobacterium gallinarum]|uniref:ABC transporter permease n=1 Tax=Carnobacterium gallinarum TaxID=2749 RepID=UPI0005582FDE|nr:FtsX-like permease family protein [Carnobacterium gallinarum]